MHDEGPAVAADDHEAQRLAICGTEQRCRSRRGRQRDRHTILTNSGRPATPSIADLAGKALKRRLERSARASAGNPRVATGARFRRCHDALTGNRAWLFGRTAGFLFRLIERTHALHTHQAGKFVHARPFGGGAGAHGFRRWFLGLVRVPIWRLKLGSLARSGAQGRDRTADTVIFSHVLYQLSYLGTRGQSLREAGL